MFWSFSCKSGLRKRQIPKGSCSILVPVNIHNFDMYVPEGSSWRVSTIMEKMASDEGRKKIFCTIKFQTELYLDFLNSTDLVSSPAPLTLQWNSWALFNLRTRNESGFFLLFSKVPDGTFIQDWSCHFSLLIFYRRKEWNKSPLHAYSCYRTSSWKGQVVHLEHSWFYKIKAKLIFWAVLITRYCAKLFCPIV